MLLSYPVQESIVVSTICTGVCLISCGNLWFYVFFTTWVDMFVFFIEPLQNDNGSTEVFSVELQEQDVSINNITKKTYW